VDADDEAQEPSLFRAPSAPDCRALQEVEDGATEQEQQGGVVAAVQREASAVQGMVQPGAGGPGQATTMQPASSTAPHHRHHQLPLVDEEAQQQQLTTEGVAKAGDTQHAVEIGMLGASGLAAAGIEPATAGAEEEPLLEVGWSGMSCFCGL
jgi:hypothetical protein